MASPTTARSTDAGLADAYCAPPPAVEETLVTALKALGDTTPAPRHDPFYGLDRRANVSLPLLARLSRHGDFRKYVLVLDAGAGIGGPGRWLALRYGCRVVALDLSQARLRLAGRLAARAGLTGRVRSVVGRLEAVPVRDGAFTQIWSVEALHHVADLGRAVAELHRVVRPGSPLALQEIVRRGSEVPRIGGVFLHHTTDDYLTALADAGFDAIDHEDVTMERREISPVVLSVRARFARMVAERLPPDDPWRRAEAVHAAVDDIVAGPDYRVLHFFARRPST